MRNASVVQLTLVDSHVHVVDIRVLYVTWLTLIEAECIRKIGRRGRRAPVSKFGAVST